MILSRNFYVLSTMLGSAFLCYAAQVLNDVGSSYAINSHKMCNIRVLLDQKKESGQWVLETDAGIIVSEMYNPAKKAISKHTSHIIAYHNNNLWINGKRLTEKQIKIDTLTGSMRCFGRVYPGSLLIVIEHDMCFLINQLDLEMYVYCVLAAESWPGWPLEVNKVFAIIARTYVLAKMLGSRNRRLFHIKNTNIDQTYNGLHAHETLKKAVEETTGLIVIYNEKPITAMYDSCCGGIVPALLSGVDFKKFPYLARKNACTYCQSCKIYDWSYELDTQEFEKLLQANGISVCGITAISAKHDCAGSVQEILVESTSGLVRLTGKQLYACSRKIKSFCYSIKKVFKKICIKGKGYGHHLGLCQWGARTMVDKGWNYRTILRFYYPGTTCKRLLFT